MKSSALILALIAACTTSAAAERVVHASRWHAGINLRADLGTHQARLAAGVETSSWDATLVLDPSYLLDGEHDLDLLAERRFAPWLAAAFGWRWSTIDVADGHHHQQRSIVGVTAAFPDLASGRIRSRLTLELATLWVKHGGGSQRDWISFDRNLLDHLAFGMFLRIEYASPF